MIRKLVKGKVFVFIDAANIFYAQKTLKWRISYERLRKYFKKECNLGKCFVYTAFAQEDEGQNRFIKMLKKSGFIVRTKPVKRIRITKGVYEWKGNFDVELTMDVIDNLSKFKTLILLSGDSDFAPLLKRVKEHEKRVIVMSTKDHVAKELLEQAKFVNLKKLKEEIVFKT
jgi:uncharacterized LabA/DUF88 family protein